MDQEIYRQDRKSQDYVYEKRRLIYHAIQISQEPMNLNILLPEEKVFKQWCGQQSGNKWRLMRN